MMTKIFSWLWVLVVAYLAACNMAQSWVDHYPQAAPATKSVPVPVPAQKPSPDVTPKPNTKADDKLLASRAAVISRIEKTLHLSFLKFDHGTLVFAPAPNAPPLASDDMLDRKLDLLNTCLRESEAKRLEIERPGEHYYYVVSVYHPRRFSTGGLVDYYCVLDSIARTVPEPHIGSAARSAAFIFLDQIIKVLQDISRIAPEDEQNKLNLLVAIEARDRDRAMAQYGKDLIGWPTAISHAAADQNINKTRQVSPQSWFATRMQLSSLERANRIAERNRLEEQAAHEGMYYYTPLMDCYSWILIVAGIVVIAKTRKQLRAADLALPRTVKFCAPKIMVAFSFWGFVGAVFLTVIVDGFVWMYLNNCMPQRLYPFAFALTNPGWRLLREICGFYSIFGTYIALAMVMMVKGRGGKISHLLRFWPERDSYGWKDAITLGVVAAFVILIIESPWVWVFSWLGWNGDESFTSTLIAAGWLVGYFAKELAMVVILGPITEEIVFRGLGFYVLRQKWGWFAAAFVTSTVFALMHYDFEPPAMASRFIFGMVACYVYERSRTLVAPVMAHIVNNLISTSFNVLFWTCWFAR